MGKDNWWEKYNSQKLCNRYYDYFNEWWDPDKFSWKPVLSLTICCDIHFKTWWNPDKYDWYYSDALAKYCADYFNMWWDAEKFDWVEGRENLHKWCSSKFSEQQLKRLLFHSNKLAREFASEELKRRKDDKGRVLENI